MLFYRVKKEGDGMDVYDHTRRRYVTQLIAGELYTAKEIARHNLGIYSRFFEPVEVSKRATYWCFGARYELGTN